VPPGPAEAGQKSPEVAPSEARQKRHRRSAGAANRRPGAETREDSEDAEEDGDTTEDEEKRREDDEQRWRARMAEARDQVQRSRMFADALQSRINALNTDFSARDDPAQRSVIGTELNKALAELERVRGDIEAQEKAVTDLEEEARRAGVPPGWLR
jgi:chromosome segregation ATPase